MKEKIIRFVKKNRKLLILIPLYVLYLIVIEIIMGVGSGKNVWDEGRKWAKKEET